jgi:4-oxalocrotonate tautomerase
MCEAPDIVHPFGTPGSRGAPVVGRDAGRDMVAAGERRYRRAFRPPVSMEKEHPMPFVRIDLARGKSPDFRKGIGEIIYRAMTEVIDVPADDKFQIITEHAPEDLNFAPSYLGITHSPGIVLIQITLSAGRSVERKKAFYQRIADDLHAELGIRKEDVVINLVEVAKENWSFGNGIAQYVT